MWGSVGIGEINRDITSCSGLLFRLNTLLVVMVAGIVTGMVSGLSFYDVISMFGKFS